MIASRMHRPRLLPATIAAMALLLVVKSVSLVWAATASPPSGPVKGGPGSPGAAASAPDTSAPPQGGDKPATRTAAGIAETKTPGTAAAASGSAQGSGEAGGPAADTAAQPPVSNAERALLLDLRKRRASLDERGRELDQRGAVLSAAETKLASRVEQLSGLQARLEQLESERRAHDDANWSGLVHVYETMKPREAAAIFDALDMQVLLAVLDRMQPRKAAPVLAAMQPDRARLATQMLAELRTRAVTPPAPAHAGGEAGAGAALPKG